MAPTDRRAREKAERRERIVTTARAVAEAEGWPAVTTRRLADEIDYTPPVLYQHFPSGRDGVIAAVALAGFADFVDVAGSALKAGDDALATLVDTYMAFARTHPATYEAMFSLSVAFEFAADSTPDVLRAGFDLFVDAIGRDRDDVTVRAELLWSALHGVCELDRHHRLDPALADARRELLVAQAR
ncbi:MAG: TetR/AcrR family transcriptional regulator [Williamsia herbipolensis]|nr:TetR/AcrR family transcriptional regulator [Williamsia herbipolensis]